MPDARNGHAETLGNVFIAGLVDVEVEEFYQGPATVGQFRDRAFNYEFLFDLVNFLVGCRFEIFDGNSCPSRAQDGARRRVH